ncbi:MAG: hypothetical protein P8M30_01640 [Planctomycetaceae bacterium]|nr:hypothetical protein [Planctomycetaceae bacterium]
MSTRGDELHGEVKDVVGNLYVAMAVCYLSKENPEIDKAELSIKTCQEFQPKLSCPADDIRELLYLKKAEELLRHKDFKSAKALLDKCRTSKLTRYFGKNVNMPSLYDLEKSNASRTYHEKIVEMMP